MFSRRIGGAADRLDHTPAFEVVADQRTLVAEDEVHAADCRGGFGGPIQQGNDGLFMRFRAMRSPEAQGPQTADGGSQVLRGDLERQVSPVQVLIGKGPLHQILSGVAADGERQQGQQRLHCGTRHGTPPALVWFETLTPWRYDRRLAAVGTTAQVLLKAAVPAAAKRWPLTANHK